jgi:hypothetical protein
MKLHLFHLRLTPTDGEHPDMATADGYGGTLLAALADLERATIAIYGIEAAFADNPTFVNEASEVLESLSAPDSRYCCFDMSCPEDAFRIDRLHPWTQGSRKRMKNTDILAPTNLSAAGTAAHAAIVKLLRKKRMTYTGGCRAFYSPAEWQARKEDHGKESELIVVYDGGDLGCFFEFDKLRPDLIDQMNQALGEIGMIAQPCTCWYAAIYPIAP